MRYHIYLRRPLADPKHCGTFDTADLPEQYAGKVAMLEAAFERRRASVEGVGELYRVAGTEDESTVWLGGW